MLPTSTWSSGFPSVRIQRSVGSSGFVQVMTGLVSLLPYTIWNIAPLSCISYKPKVTGKHALVKKPLQYSLRTYKRRAFNLVIAFSMVAGLHKDPPIIAAKEILNEKRHSEDKWIEIIAGKKEVECSDRVWKIRIRTGAMQWSRYRNKRLQVWSIAEDWRICYAVILECKGRAQIFLGRYEASRVKKRRVCFVCT